MHCDYNYNNLPLIDKWYVNKIYVFLGATSNGFSPFDIKYTSVAKNDDPVLRRNFRCA